MSNRVGGADHGEAVVQVQPGQMVLNPVGRRGGGDGKGNLFFFQHIQQRINPRLCLDSVFLDVGIHQFNALGTNLAVDNVRAEKAAEIGLPRLCAEAAHSQCLLIVHIVAVKGTARCPELGIELFRVQNYAVHVEQDTFNFCVPGMQNLICQ